MSGDSGSGDELLGDLRSAGEQAARAAEAVRPEQLGAPTPCTEFDVRTLANHLVLWTSHNFEARAHGGSAPEEFQRRDFTAEPGWAADYRAALGRALDAWSDPAVWGRELDVMGSRMAARDVAGMMLMEIALHGWDLARAVGEEYRLPEGTAERLLARVEAAAPMFRQYNGFAEPVTGLPADRRRSTGRWRRRVATRARRPERAPASGGLSGRRRAERPAGRDTPWAGRAAGQTVGRPAAECAAAPAGGAGAGRWRPAARATSSSRRVRRSPWRARR